MKMMYIVYSADKKPLGIFKDRKSRDIQLNAAAAVIKVLIFAASSGHTRA